MYYSELHFTLQITIHALKKIQALQKWTMNVFFCKFTYPTP